MHEHHQHGPAVRALRASLASGRDLGETTALILCAVAADDPDGVDAVTRNRPGSWEAALIRRLVTGTAGEDGEHLDAYRIAPGPETVAHSCPQCAGAGTTPYIGRSGDAVRRACDLCEGTGSLDDLLSQARTQTDNELVRRLARAVAALDDRRQRPTASVRLEVDVDADTADRLAALDAENHVDADAERSAAWVLRQYTPAPEDDHASE